MGQYQVPQFIETEDKIIGPLNLRQFAYLMGLMGVLFILWFYISLFFFILVAIPVVGIPGVLLLGRYNGRPLIVMFIAWLNFVFGNTLYLWKKEKEEMRFGAKKGFDLPKKDEEAPEEFVPQLTQSRLQQLASALDVKQVRPEAGAQRIARLEHLPPRIMGTRSDNIGHRDGGVELKR